MDLIAAELNENVQISTALSIVITLCMAQSDPQRAAAQATAALTRGLAAAIEHRNSR